MELVPWLRLSWFSRQYLITREIILKFMPFRLGQTNYRNKSVLVIRNCEMVISCLNLNFVAFIDQIQARFYPFFMSQDNRVKDAISEWDAIKAKYGDFQIIDEPSALPDVDPKRIWTEFWRQDQFISNTYVKVDEFDGEITCYYVFEKPYLEDEDSITLITTFWDDCETCFGEDEECEECAGDGSIAIEVI